MSNRVMAGLGLAAIAVIAATGPVQAADAQGRIQVAQKAAPKKAPATRAKAKATTTAPKAKSTKAKKPKTKSACQGLTATSCKAKSTCSWVVPKKKKDVRGRTLKAYCRTKSGFAKKKAKEST